MIIINCPDCSVEPGQIHKPGCDQERCTVCGRQYLAHEREGHEHDSSLWKPWDTFKADADILDIKEPPCRYCRYWKPQRSYMNMKYGVVFDGIICCHAEDQHRDFSCFKSKDV